MEEVFELILKVYGILFGIVAILAVVAKLQKANRTIDQASYLPGGKNYIHPMEEEAEYEELAWKAHA